MRVSLPQTIVIATYLAFVGGLALLTFDLSAQVGTKALALAQPLVVFKGDPEPTLVERREQAMVRRVSTFEDEAPLIPDAPSIPLTELVANLDEAERADRGSIVRPARSRPRVRRAPSSNRVAAAEVFGRSFGVMLRVTR